MKIALITDGIWPYVIGGMQKHSYFLCKYLLKQGVEVILVHTAAVLTDRVRNADIFKPEERRNLTVITVERPTVRKYPGQYVFWSYAYSRRIDRAIRQIDGIDFIIAKGLTALYILKHRQSTIPPIAVNIHGYEFMQKNTGIKMHLQSIVLGMPLKWVNRKADYVFSYGGRITHYIKQIGVPKEKILEVSGAIEKDWIADSLPLVVGRRKMVFVGRRERRKGFEELTLSIKQLYNKYDFEFHFIGPVEEDVRLSLDRIYYHGVVSEKARLQQILQGVHVLVCPSYAEGMPNVILEGMANGCAIIATNVGAISLMVDAANGWLIKPGDVNELVDTLVKAITLSEFDMMEMRNRSLEKVKVDFLWEKVGRELYNKIVALVEKEKNKALSNNEAYHGAQ